MTVTGAKLGVIRTLDVIQGRYEKGSLPAIALAIAAYLSTYFMLGQSGFGLVVGAVSVFTLYMVGRIFWHDTGYRSEAALVAVAMAVSYAVIPLVLSLFAISSLG